VRTRNQQVDEQRCLHVKNRDSNLPMIFTEQGSTGACRALALGNKLAGRSVRRFFGATASAIDFSIRPRSLLVERTAVVSFSNAARMTSRLRKSIEFLLVRRAKSCGVNRRGFGVRFAFNFKGVLCGGGTDRATSLSFWPLIFAPRRGLRTESGRDLVPLARHALDDFLRHRRVVFAAFKTFVEQFDPEVGDFLTRALGDLFLYFAAPVLNIGNCGGQNLPVFSAPRRAQVSALWLRE